MALLNLYPSQAPQSYPPYRGIGDFGVIASPKTPRKQDFGDFGVIGKRGAVKPTTAKNGFFSGTRGKHGKVHTMRL